MTPDAAQEWVTRLQVERREVEVTHLDVPRGEHARNGRKAVKTAIFTLTLNLGLIDGRTRLWRIPPHHSLGADVLTRRNGYWADRRRPIRAEIWTASAANPGRDPTRARLRTTGGVSQCQCL